MKKIWIFIGIFTLFSLAMSDDAFSKSSENKAACERWCNDNKPRCVRCDSNAFCGGRTYDVIQSFKKGTGNWYACGLSEYGSASQKNKADCEAWCRQDERCEFCKDKIGCGAGYTSIARYGNQGENWYACGRTEYGQASQKNKTECEAWCRQNKECKFCKDRIGCGNGYYPIETFGGRGENWYACGGAILDQCLEWCRNDPRCEYCSPAVSCDFGRLDGQVIKKFLGTSTIGLFGTADNWYACELSERGLLTKERLEDCDNWCKSSDSCDFCTIRRSECGADVKVVARFRGKGDTVYACKKR